MHKEAWPYGKVNASNVESRGQTVHRRIRAGITFHRVYITKRLTSAEVTIRTAPVYFRERDEASQVIVYPTKDWQIQRS